MNIGEIHETYGTYIWSISRRYCTGIWEPEAMYNELLIVLTNLFRQNKLGDGHSEDSIKLIKSAIITKAIQIVRRENRRRMEQIPESTTIEEVAYDRPHINYEKEMTKIWLILVTRLPYRTAKFIFELAFPSFTTLEIAMRERRNAFVARDHGELKMNIHNELEVLPKHVAEYMERCGENRPSIPAMTKMKGQAREVLSDVYDIVSPEDQIFEEIFGNSYIPDF
jgi:hypothetical protein